MKFYMIYSNQYATGNTPIGIASLAAILKKAGHQFKLFDCTEFSVIRKGAFTDWNKTGEKTLQFMTAENQERLPEREKVNYEQLIHKVIVDIDNFKPDALFFQEAIKTIFDSNSREKKNIVKCSIFNNIYMYVLIPLCFYSTLQGIKIPRNGRFRSRP